MSGILYEGGPNAFWVFLVVTIILGGAAALATGRAVARTWRPFAPVPFQMLILSGFVCFLHYALFGEDLTSLQYLIVDFIILLAFCMLGYRMTIAQKMIRQYPWLYETAGPLSWKSKD